MVVIVLKYHSNRIAFKTSPATCSLPPCAMVCDQRAPQPHRAQEVGEVQLVTLAQLVEKVGDGSGQDALLVVDRDDDGDDG